MKIFEHARAAIACAVVSLSSLGFAGHADAVTFDFTGGGPNGNSLTFLEGGISLTATALTGGTNPSATRVSHGQNGLGVGNGASPEGGRIASGEVLILDFSPSEVLLIETIVFESQQEIEFLSLQIDGQNRSLGGLPTVPGTPGNLQTFNFAAFPPSLRTGSILSFRGSSFSDPNGGNTGVRIASISVGIVPLPATALLLLTAIGGVALVARRRAL